MISDVYIIWPLVLSLAPGICVPRSSCSQAVSGLSCQQKKAGLVISGEELLP